MTGPLEDDGKGTWQHGGGKNGLVKIILELQENQAWEVKRTVERCGFVIKTRLSE